MTLQRLIDLALDSDYIDIYSDNCEYMQLRSFEVIWKDFMDKELEDIQLSIVHPTPPSWTQEDKRELMKLLSSYHKG